MISEVIKKEELNQYKINKINNYTDNCLFRQILTCYSWHQPLYLNPDDILNNILLIYSRYIDLNSGRFRDIFVKHSGKKELTVVSDGGYDESRIDEFCEKMVLVIKDDQCSDIVSWADVKLSTTKSYDTLLRNACVLSSQKAYYDYGWEFCCGFPEVNLLGTVEDWKTLVATIEKMPELDSFLKGWKQNLVTIILRMTEGDEHFWQTCATITKYGSGGQERVDGWLVLFNPFRDDLQKLKSVKSDEIMNLYADFEVNVNDNGNQFKINVVAGSKLEYLDDKIQIVPRLNINNVK